jgi:hypothetical protein
MGEQKLMMEFFFITKVLCIYNDLVRDILPLLYTMTGNENCWCRGQDLKIHSSLHIEGSSPQQHGFGYESLKLKVKLTRIPELLPS